MSEKPSFFAELKRRHVWRVAIAYVVVSWLLLQLAAILFPAFGAPHWAIRLLFAFLVIGFLVALLLAWAFEVTPEGVRRTESAEAEEARPTNHRRHVGRVLNIGIIVVLAAAVGILVWRLSLKPKPTAAKMVATSAASSAEATTAATKIPAKSIAVLPFENLSADKNNKYFADGMQDLILTKLADIGDLKVIARTSTMQYGSHPQNLTEIGKELGVATLLEGSVQKAGNQVMINVQLIDARTDSHIWAQAYTRTLKNVFGVEGEVAESIANTLNAKLSPAETQRLANTLSDDPKANDLFLRAEYFANRIFENSNFSQTLIQAIPLYRQALARAPDFALARARLSYVESVLAFRGGGGEDIKKLEADAHAQGEQAMKLAPDLPAAHLAMGYYDYMVKDDYAAALKAFAAALKLRPNDASALLARGAVLRRQGKFNEAIKAMKRALILNPRSTETNIMLGWTYMAINRYGEAEQALQRAIALSPSSNFARNFYARAVLLRTGNVSRVLGAIQGDSANDKKLRATLLAYQRKFGAAIALVKGLPNTPADFPDSSKDFTLAHLYELSGDQAEAKIYYAKALPNLHAFLQREAGNPDTAASAWNDIAEAELGVGKTNEGIKAIKTALVKGEEVKDHLLRPQIVVDAASNYAQARRADKAVSLISRALITPGTGAFYSPVMLWLDPAWDPIRNTPEFQALLKKYAKYKPATVPTVGSAPTAATAPAS